MSKNSTIENKDIVLVTLDTLRYDVAEEELSQGRLPVLAKYIQSWEKRHAPGSFTYPSHQAIFTGFLPTPFDEPKAERLFSLAFPGSETTSKNTLIFNSDNIVAGFKGLGYHTVCIGGVGFFNKQTPLASVLPGMFEESYWQPSFGVTDPCSTENQLLHAKNVVEKLPCNRRLFLFINISAIHQPNSYYINAEEDSKFSHAAALRYVDSQLNKLFSLFNHRHDTFYILCSDHGTAYGEAGYQGHRLAHDTVWTVPYAQFTIPKEEYQQ